MYRQSPSRNQRSKQIRVKHVIQICALIAVCFWLIYQVKHSHDKKKEFDESDAKALTEGEDSNDLIKLGRKDIRPLVDEITSKNVKHDESAEEDETTGEEVDENRIEEDEPEENKKVEAKEDKEMNAVDDETDDHEEEKSDAEANKEEDVVDDEEREGADETENQETDSEDGQSQSQTDSDGDDRSAHEAREEHYKADDASSAVTHDTPIVTSGNESELSEKTNNEENSEGEMRKDLDVRDDDYVSNVTTAETKVEEGSSSTNNTVTGGSDDQTSNTSSEVIVETHDDDLSSQNVTEGANNSSVNVDSNRLDSDSTETKDAESHSDGFSNSSNNSTDSSASEKITTSVEEGNNTESKSEKNDEIQAVKSDEGDGTYETSESTVTENPEEVQHEDIDISDTSNSAEETNVRVDLDTLPQIQTQGIDNDDAAAE